MRNETRIEGETAYVRLRREDGNDLEAVVDVTDLPLIADFRWIASYSRNSAGRQFYVKATKDYKTYYLHRILMNPPKELEVDHINRNPLDNRRENLRVVTRQGNRDNNPGSLGYTSGAGYCWDNSDKRWRVTLKCLGKVVRRNFKTEQEAREFVAKTREEMGAIIGKVTDSTRVRRRAA
jgi:hypothetical protein